RANRRGLGWRRSEPADPAPPPRALLEGVRIRRSPDPRGRCRSADASGPLLGGRRALLPRRRRVGASRSARRRRCQSRYGASPRGESSEAVRGLPLVRAGAPLCRALGPAGQMTRGIAHHGCPRLHVPRDYGSSPDDRPGTDYQAAQEPILAPSSTRVSSSFQSASVRSNPSSVVACGYLSLTNTAPCPTNTPSPIITPVQMKAWLWILQSAPIWAPRWISTNGPTRVLSPILQP